MAKEGKSYSPKEDEDTVEPEKISIESKIREAETIDSNAEVLPEKKPKNMNLYYLIGAVSMLLTIFIIYKVFLMNDSDIIVTEKPFEEIIAEENLAEPESNDDETNDDKTRIGKEHKRILQIDYIKLLKLEQLCEVISHN